MAWSDLTLSGATLYGIDRTAFASTRSATIKQSETTDEGRRLIAAAGKVRVLLQGPKYCGPFAASYGVAAFFDALAADSSLAGDIGQLLAHAYAWFRYTHDSRSAGDIDDVRAERQLECMRELLAAISTTAPVTIGATDQKPGMPVVRAIASAIDTLGNETYLD